METLLEYIGSYDEIRACTGMAKSELKDEDIELLTCRLTLSQALTSIKGVYGGEVDTQRNLVEIFADESTEQEMKGAIQLFSIYTVGRVVAGSLAMKAPKTRAEGRASLARFSPESAYLSVIESINDNLVSLSSQIYSMFSDYADVSLNFSLVVTPATDPVTGA